jgi:hypothetical protein
MMRFLARRDILQPRSGRARIVVVVTSARGVASLRPKMARPPHLARALLGAAVLTAAALAAAGLPACGLLPEDDGAGAFPSDGIGDLGAAEPIEVCLGTAHVVAPSASTGAGAVCVAEGATAAACSADAGCTGIERCVCGRCVVEACDASVGCGEGRVCRARRCTVGCAADADCDEGEVCAAGGCARRCAGDGDCHFGERCDALDDTCVAKLCGAAGSCGAGSRCEALAVTGELHEPEVASDALAFVEIRGDDGPAVYRMRIDAPSRWTADPEGPVLEGAGAPSVIAHGDHVELTFASAAGIERATSEDGGRTFTRDAAPLLTAALPWENGFVGSPSLRVFRGATVLFYEGGPRAGVGVARVESGVATRLADAPLATPASVSDPRFWRDVSEVGAPSALVVGDAVRVYFTARGVEGLGARIGASFAPADPNDSIGLLASTDLGAFAASPTGPVFARMTNLRTYLGEREASLRLMPSGGVEITFVATDASGQNVAGLQRAAR